MGLSSSTLLPCMFSKKKLRVVVVGLDAAGKTTIMRRLKLSETACEEGSPMIPSTTPPLITTSYIDYKNFAFHEWDQGGQDRVSERKGDRLQIRSLWRLYYKGSHGVIFVVDSSNRDRIDGLGDRHDSAKEELHGMLAVEELSHAALLVFANKQDLPGAMTVPEVADRLGLNQLRNRQWCIQGTSAVTGLGISDGLDWLSNMIATRQE